MGDLFHVETAHLGGYHGGIMARGVGDNGFCLRILCNIMEDSVLSSPAAEGMLCSIPAEEICHLHQEIRDRRVLDKS